MGVCLMSVGRILRSHNLSIVQFSSAKIYLFLQFYCIFQKKPQKLLKSSILQKATKFKESEIQNSSDAVLYIGANLFPWSYQKSPNHQKLRNFATKFAPKISKFWNFPNFLEFSFAERRKFLESSLVLFPAPSDFFSKKIAKSGAICNGFFNNHHQ